MKKIYNNIKEEKVTAEKSFDKIQNPFMIKSLKELDTEKSHLNIKTV